MAPAYISPPTATTDAQIYQITTNGNNATRISFEDNYNANPSISFDDKKIAMAQGTNNTYRIALYDHSISDGR
jgi:Periplasmic component of the Tol biopolymer transport system